MNFPASALIAAGLCLLSAFFWWQERRKGEDRLSLRGRIHQRLTFLFAALAVYQFLAFR